MKFNNQAIMKIIINVLIFFVTIWLLKNLPMIIKTILIMNLEALNLEELTKKESELVNAGESSESGWYWVTYFVGGFVRASYEMGVSAQGNPHI